MLSAARDLLEGHRVAQCHRLLIPYEVSGRPGVDVLVNDHRARFGNLAVCANVWACPVCAPRISAARSSEVAQLLQAHLASGGRVLFGTFTFQHDRKTALRWMLDMQAAARVSMHEAREYKKLCKQLGVIGSIRALEVTHNRKSGWHPHIHELFLVSGDMKMRDYYRGCGALASMWIKYAKQHGLYANTKANKVLIASEDAKTLDDLADYLMPDDGNEKDTDWAIKEAEEHLSRDISNEIARFNTKKARTKDGRSPMQLLREFALTGDYYYGRLFVEYVSVFKGRRQLVVKGAKKLKEIVKEVSDEEAAKNEDAADVLLGSITTWEWRCILHDSPKARGLILEAARSGNWDDVEVVIQGCVDRQGHRVPMVKEAKE